MSQVERTVHSKVLAEIDETRDRVRVDLEVSKRYPLSHTNTTQTPWPIPCSGSHPTQQSTPSAVRRAVVDGRETVSLYTIASAMSCLAASF